MNLTLVSKQVYKDCKRPGIEWKIIPIIEIRPRQCASRSMRAWVLIQKLYQHLLNNETKEKLQYYRYMKMNGTHKFEGAYSRELQENVIGLQMDWILSLDLSSYSSPPSNVCNYFALALSKILPNLCEIDLSNTCLHMRALRGFSENCPLLAKITIHNIDCQYSYVFLNGYGMISSNNLKAIYMDDSNLSIPNKEEISNLNNPAFNNRFIFHYCCKTLERVSIRNTKWYHDGTSEAYDCLTKLIN
jgi:hypothetical protein